MWDGKSAKWVEAKTDGSEEDRNEKEEFVVGSTIEVLSSSMLRRTCTVKEVNKEEIKIHYIHDRYDKWIPKNDYRIIRDAEQPAEELKTMSFIETLRASAEQYTREDYGWYVSKGKYYRLRNPDENRDNIEDLEYRLWWAEKKHNESCDLVKFLSVMDR